MVEVSEPRRAGIAREELNRNDYFTARHFAENMLLPRECRWSWGVEDQRTSFSL